MNGSNSYYILHKYISSRLLFLYSGLETYIFNFSIEVEAQYLEPQFEVITNQQHNLFIFYKTFGELHV